MSILERERTPASRGTYATAGDIEIVIPVYNEAAGLAESVKRLRDYLDSSFPYVTTVTIVDNASTDGTWRIATELARTLPRTDAVHLDRKGRGRALRHAWLASDAPVVAYMDVDLSTDLDALLPLVAPLLSGHSDVAIGSRLAPGAHVVRGPKRELISRSYNLLLRTVLGGRFSDAQCGFKALRRDAVDVLVPLVEDEEWFFDTEILVLAQRHGFRIAEVPVDGRTTPTPGWTWSARRSRTSGGCGGCSGGAHVAPPSPAPVGWPRPMPSPTTSSGSPESASSPPWPPWPCSPPSARPSAPSSPAWPRSAPSAWPTPPPTSAWPGSPDACPVGAAGPWWPRCCGR